MIENELIKKCLKENTTKGLTFEILKIELDSIYAAKNSVYEDLMKKVKSDWNEYYVLKAEIMDIKALRQQLWDFNSKKNKFDSKKYENLPVNEVVVVDEFPEE